MTLTFCDAPLHKPDWLRQHPIAHRGLHDTANEVYENTLSAAQAAVACDYSIEVDLQPSLDGEPMVFHDYDLSRMTSMGGEIRKTPSRELAKMPIQHSDDKIPTLEQLLELVNGKVGLVLELKGHQPSDHGFVKAVVDRLNGYVGPVVIMSFAHHLLKDARKHASHIPLGLTAEGNDKRYDVHRKIAVETNVDFVSYHVENLETRFAQQFRGTKRPLISWTIKNKQEAEYSYTYSDQPTFEGFTL